MILTFMGGRIRNDRAYSIKSLLSTGIPVFADEYIAQITFTPVLYVLYSKKTRNSDFNRNPSMFPRVGGIGGDPR